MTSSAQVRSARNVWITGGPRLEVRTRPPGNTRNAHNLRDDSIIHVEPSYTPFGLTFPTTSYRKDEVRQGGEWWELVASVGTVKVERRRLEGAEDPRLMGNGQPDPYDFLADDDWEGRQGSFEDLTRARGEIREWTSRSRARMLYRIATVDWEALPGVPEMLTLTYPREYPADGPTCKAHLRTFQKRYERRFGKMYAAWKMEFQKRGAPHFHLLIRRPASIGWREFEGWCARAWFEVVGSGDPRHLRAGVGLDREVIRRAGRSGAKIAWYFAKHAGPGQSSSKAYQNEVPQNFRSPGRFWGLIGVSSSEVAVPLDPHHAAELGRWIASLSASRSPRGRRRRRSVVRTWSLSSQPAHFLAAFVRWCRPPERVWVHQRTGEVVTWPPGRPRPLP